MKEEYVSFELAKKLKEKGFRERVRGHYKSKAHLSVCSEPMNCNGVDNGELSAPQIHEALDWLRKKKKIYVLIDFFLFNGNTQTIWTFTIKNIMDVSTYCVCEDCRRKSFKEAALAGIEYVIDNLI